MPSIKLLTLPEYQKLNPLSQGYAVYMQAEWPGSELKDERNPYSPGTHEQSEWNRGQMIACQDAQDSEE